MLDEEVKNNIEFLLSRSDLILDKIIKFFILDYEKNKVQLIKELSVKVSLQSELIRGLSPKYKSSLLKFLIVLRYTEQNKLNNQINEYDKLIKTYNELDLVFGLSDNLFHRITIKDVVNSNNPSYDKIKFKTNKKLLIHLSNITDQNFNENLCRKYVLELDKKINSILFEEFVKYLNSFLDGSFGNGIIKNYFFYDKKSIKIDGGMFQIDLLVNGLKFNLQITRFGTVYIGDYLHKSKNTFNIRNEKINYIPKILGLNKFMNCKKKIKLNMLILQSSSSGSIEYNIEKFLKNEIENLTNSYDEIDTMLIESELESYFKRIIKFSNLLKIYKPQVNMKKYLSKKVNIVSANTDKSLYYFLDIINNTIKGDKDKLCPLIDKLHDYIANHDYKVNKNLNQIKMFMTGRRNKHLYLNDFVLLLDEFKMENKKGLKVIDVDKFERFVNCVLENKDFKKQERLESLDYKLSKKMDIAFN